MADFNWLSLQNGSDIRGVATGDVPGEPITLTPDVVKSIAVAFVSWLSEMTGDQAPQLKIAVGRDSRISGPSLMDAFISGVRSTGAGAIDCSLSTTPAMFMSTVLDQPSASGAVMLTASHLPFNRNGLKFFTRTGGLDKPDIRSILIRAETIRPQEIETGQLSQFDLIAAYSNELVQTIRQSVNHPQHFNTPMKGFRIVVDAGNGSGGFFASQVLEPLGADTTGSQFLDPDGRFPNHVPNPEDEAAMRSIREAVLENQADIGIIFDTDVDRAALVDSTGTLVNRNRLVALISAIVLEEHPGTTVVTDSITSDGLTQFIIRQLGGFHHRFKRGYKNVINEALRLNNSGRECWLAIETSGHAALKENHFLDDGAYLMTRILIKAAQMRLSGGNLRQLTAGLQEPLECREFRIRLKTPEFSHLVTQILADLQDFVMEVDGWSLVPDTYEGVRVACSEEYGHGWFLLRMSLHDPVMPLNIESEQEGGITVITEYLKEFLGDYDDLEFNFSV